MTTQKFIKTIETHILNDSAMFDKDVPKELIQVWYCKTIQNHKGLFIVRNLDTNALYPYFIEATYNGDNQELYLDYYLKKTKEILMLDK